MQRKDCQILKNQCERRKKLAKTSISGKGNCEYPGKVRTWHKIDGFPGFCLWKQFLIGWSEKLRRKNAGEADVAGCKERDFLTDMTRKRK
jgi:hypothetical protein